MNFIMRINLNRFRRLKVNFSYRLFCSSTSNHPYDNVIPFESNKQLAKYLCEHILYDDKGIIVLNKPYGISFSRDPPKWKSDVQKPKAGIVRHKIEEILSNPRITVEEDRVNLYSALPYIKSTLNCDTICIIKSPEKYTTGVCILGRSEAIRSKVNKCWERSHAQKIALESYLAICSGVPVRSFVNNFRVGITLDVSESGKSKKAILKKDYSKADVLNSRVFVATVHSKLLSASSDLASLVQVITNQKKWHFVRLFLASHLLTPALGDHIFASRVKKVMGTAVAVDYWSSYANQSQKLDPNLLQMLDLLPGSERFIPSMIHLSEVRLIKYSKNSEDLFLYAPPPSHFTWTMDKLGLSVPTYSSSLVTNKPADVKKSAVI